MNTLILVQQFIATATFPPKMHVKIVYFKILKNLCPIHFINRTVCLNQQLSLCDSCIPKVLQKYFTYL